MRNATGSPLFSDLKSDHSRVVRFRPLVKGNEDPGYEGAAGCNLRTCAVSHFGGNLLPEAVSAPEIVVLGGDRVGKLLRNFVQGQVDRKETSLETPRFIRSSCQWRLKFKQ